MKKKYFRVQSFKTHLRKHNFASILPLSTYLLQGYSYQCDMCPKLLLCDSYIINAHLKNAHGLTRGNKKNIPASDSKLKEYERLCSLFKNSTPTSLTYWHKPTLPINEIPIQEVTSRIGNLCIFTCQKCDSKDLPSWRVLRHHYRTVHKSGVQYNPSMVKEARCHSCLLCPTAVLNDRTCISTHLTVCHKIGLPEYERAFLRKGGETLPPYQRWREKEWHLDA